MHTNNTHHFLGGGRLLRLSSGKAIYVGCIFICVHMYMYLYICTQTIYTTLLRQGNICSMYIYICTYVYIYI